ncbi:hypothetical protein F2Q69_00046912 [Brassica cretica]|uniref:Uncharacterized protein n=1 Tax=Brassica cretica TaxID=69181 RepID=A0A8S9PNG4_BRACR|nr:hypothetical protein F2Q69_00046912 [Brassica cretica]
MPMECHLLSIGVSSGQSASPLFNRLSSVPSVSPPINRLSSVQSSLLRSIASPSYLIFSSPSQREASRHFSRRNVLSKLEVLDMVNCMLIDDDGLEYLENGCPSLQIDVTRCERVSLSGVVSIVSGHPDLHHLRKTLGVTSDNLDDQTQPCSCNRGGNVVIDQSGGAPKVKNVGASLVKLAGDGTVLSSDIKLLSMIVLLTCKNCEQEIDVTRCERVSLSGVVSIVSGHPDLHHLRKTLGVTSDNLDDQTQPCSGNRV